MTQRSTHHAAGPRRRSNGAVPRHRDTDPGHAGPRLRAARAVLSFALVAATLAATAQAREAADVLAAIEASADAIVDVSFVLEGVLIDTDGQSLRVEVEVVAIPAVPAAGLYILRPDAIADNQLVLDGEVIRSYTFMTNQVSLFDVDDPDAFGGLIEFEGAWPLDLDLAALFAGWEASIAGEEATPLGAAVVLRFDNLDPQANVAFVSATVIEDGWAPWRLTFHLADGTLFADITIRDLRRNQGLTREEVTYLPDDAEVLDRRRQ